jgi:hypothetical protein
MADIDSEMMGDASVQSIDAASSGDSGQYSRRVGAHF